MAAAPRARATMAVDTTTMAVRREPTGSALRQLAEGREDQTSARKARPTSISVLAAAPFSAAQAAALPTLREAKEERATAAVREELQTKARLLVRAPAAGAGATMAASLPMEAAQRPGIAAIQTSRVASAEAAVQRAPDNRDTS